MKTEGDLQQRASVWARGSLWPVAVGMVAVSAMTPLVSERIFGKWFSLPNLVLLAPIPLVTMALFVGLHRFCWLPFAGAVSLFLLGFYGLAYSFFPYVVPEQLTVWQAAASDEALLIVFIGAVIVLPVIGLYTTFAYRVFGGKATELRYY
jgi:cytochrome d ubiquinol oxidase subunit II